MKSLKKIKSGLFQRNFGLAKVLLDSRSLLTGRAENLLGQLSHLAPDKLQNIVSELGMMKGSLMKGGQLLLHYAGPYLSPEAREWLSQLESQSYFLEWEQIKNQIPLAWREELKIESSPLAAASLGQVHRGLSPSGIPVAMKIQYLGVDKAIDNDLLALKLLLGMMKLLPQEFPLDTFLEEIKTMLAYEMDYKREARLTKFFGEKFQGEGVIVPAVEDQYSHDKILTTHFIPGTSLRELLKANALSQSERDELGRKFLRIFLRELFEIGKIQSDAHAGNYLIVMPGQSTQPVERPTWALLDFGAVKEVPESFLLLYRQMVRGVILQDRDLYFRAFEGMGFLQSGREVDRGRLWSYGELLTEPFRHGVYDFGASDLPQTLMKQSQQLMQDVSKLSPPADLLFIDRKIGGTYFMLKTLGARVNVDEEIAPFLK